MVNKTSIINLYLAIKNGVTNENTENNIYINVSQGNEYPLLELMHYV